MQSKKRPGGISKLKFNPADVNLSPLAILFLAAGVGLLLCGSIMPNLFSAHFKNGAKNVDGFLLTDEINNGLYSNSVRKGDTIPGSQASFIAAKLGAKIHENLSDFALNLLGSRSIEDIYYGASILKAANALDSSAARIKRSVNDLREPTSGFRADSQHAATVRATYYALETLELVGAAEAFKATEDYEQVLDFVINLKDNTTGGFQNSGSLPPTIDGTYHALKILGAEHEALKGTAAFLPLCSRVDGGFRNYAADANSYFVETSNAVNTAQGLFILKSLKDNSEAAVSASNYVRSCLTGKGVLFEFGSTDLNIQAAYHFLEVAENFPSFSYGFPLVLTNTFPAVAFLLLAFGLIQLYIKQIDAATLAQISSQTNVALALLVVGAIAAHVVPILAIPIYLALGFHTTMNAYKASDTSGDTWTIILVDCVAFVIAMFGLQSSSPFIFTELYVYPLLVVWAGFSTFTVSMLSTYLVEKKLKNEVFINASYLAAIINTILLFGSLFGREGVQTVSTLIQIRGLYPVIFVATPVLLLLASNAGAALGLVYQL